MNFNPKKIFSSLIRLRLLTGDQRETINYKDKEIERQKAELNEIRQAYKNMTSEIETIVSSRNIANQSPNKIIERLKRVLKQKQ